MSSIAEALEPEQGRSRSAPSHTPSILPARPAWWIHRPRLEAELAVGAQGRLTVVTGPPGAGKTTLLAEWARRRPQGTTAWLSLETNDNEAPRFWRRVFAALAISPARGRPLVDAGDGHGTWSADRARVLLPDIQAFPAKILILDEFHVLGNRELIDSFGWLVRSLPSQIRVVVASRSDPDFGLHRLRVSGELTEIRGPDLRFTVDETSDFLTLASQRPVPTDDVVALTERTEGWAAGLQLAATAGADEDDPTCLLRRFSGGSELVADYFSHEVLDTLPAEHVRFLLDTSVLHRMTGGLCQELSGRPDAHLILESLVEQNLFVIRLDSKGRWYRHHCLFADFLRHQLGREDPSRARRARLDAAAWFRRQGDIPASLHHLIDADAYDEAFTLAAANVIQHLSIGLPDHEPLLPSQLPEAYLDHDHYRMYIVAAALLSAGRSAEGAGWLRRLEAAVTAYPDARVWQGRIDVLWAVHAALGVDAAGVLRHCGRGRELLGENGLVGPNPSDGPGPAHSWLTPMDTTIPGQLATLAARAYLWLDRPDDARAALAAHFSPDGDSEDPSRLGALALLACRDGQLRDACRFAHQALEQADRHHASHSLATLDSHLALSTVLWERHDLDGAAHHLEDALQPPTGTTTPQSFWPLECQLIRVMVSQGLAAAALGRISQLRSMKQPAGCPSLLLPQLDELESRCWYSLGDRHRALLALTSLPARHRRTELLAWADLCAGWPDRAVARLTSPLDRPVSPGAEVQRLILLARARVQLGHERDALNTIRRAVEEGRTEGYVTVFVEQASELLPLLQRIAGRFPDAYLSRLVEHAERSAASTPAGRAAPTLGQLSAREREILTYLPSHRSQGEIASEMYVSLNTVKTHIRAVYRKLGVRSRSEAVTLARAQKLLC